MLSKKALTSSFLSAIRSPFLSRVLHRQQHVTSAAASLSWIPKRPIVCNGSVHAIGQSLIVNQLPKHLSTYVFSKTYPPTRDSYDRAYFHSSSSTSSTLESYATESIIYPTSWASYSEIEIDSIELPPSKDRVIVTWSDEAGNHTPSSSSSSLSSSLTKSFPLVWLRDNCRCPQCFSPEAKSRKTAFKNLDVRCNLDTVSVSDDAKFINIKWSDGHVSNYPARWLRCNVFADSEPDPLADIPLQLWDASTCRDRLRSFDFNDLLTDDRALYEMLLEVKLLGLSVIENTPLELGQLYRLADRVGYLLPCNYGETFQVQSKVGPSNVAYTSDDLSLHTDLTYLNSIPGIQMLHCLQQADLDGGDNTLVDGFKIAQDLRKTSPDLFDVLTKHVIEFFDSGSDNLGEFFQQSRHRIIRLNHMNEVDQIVFGDHGRSAISRMPVDDVIMTYKAMSSFAALLYDPKNVFEYKMKDGDILIMNNYRTLHGRKAFTMQPGSSRHLQGGYFEWDTVMSKLRILGKNLQVV